MIRISKPQVGGGKIYSHITDEIEGLDLNLYYQVELEYEQYLDTESCDAFLVAMLTYAFITKQSIQVDGAVSEKLYYNIQSHAKHVLGLSFPNTDVSITAKELVVTRHNGKGVATGCSLGVDSLSTIYSHLYEDCPPSYRLTHLTYFNVGAMGHHDLEMAHQSYLNSLATVRQFAKEMGLPVITIESNISAIYGDREYSTWVISANIGAVLILQKLLGKYYFSSTYPLETMMPNNGDDEEHYGTLLVHSLSTESTELSVSDVEKGRFDKTRVVANNELSKRYLYVCWKDIILNTKSVKAIEDVKDKFLNCTRCDKCLRTCLALDILGKGEEFTTIFDWNYYKKTRTTYIAKVLAGRKENYFYGDLYDAMMQNNYHIPFKAKAASLVLRQKRLVPVVRYLYKLKRR